ncbi:MAG TPA: hypothetical protein VNA25_14410 [Phycisphaerae bacterium]|nr:hypothetical protein [Phycisphaerae bacterium]
MPLPTNPLRAYLAAFRIPQPADLQGDRPYLEALDWAQTFRPLADRSHRWACDYALENYRRLEATADYLDAKAETLVRHVGAGAAVLISGLTFLGKADLTLALFLVPAAFCALRIMQMAIVLRSPQLFVMPPAAKPAIEYADSYATQEEAQTRFAAQFHAAAKGLELTITRKGEILSRASTLLLPTLYLLFLPLVILVVRALLDP